MPRLAPVPTDIVFAVSDAPLVGVTRSRARRLDLDRPFHGVRSTLSGADGVDRVCREFEPVMLEGHAFSHVTALALHGIPIPTPSRPVHVAVPFPRTPPRGVGVAGHSLKHVPATLVRGFVVVDLVEAWCQSAAVLGVPALVAAGDAIVTGSRVGGVRGPGRATLDELGAAARGWRRRPGAGRLRAALSRIRVGVDSPRETRLRLALVTAGLPEPAVDHEVVLADGRIRHSDLAYPGARIAIEYEGDRHRTDRRRWRSDIRRREDFEDVGWRVVRATADDLDDPVGFAALAARIARLLAERSRRASHASSPSARGESSVGPLRPRSARRR